MKRHCLIGLCFLVTLLFCLNATAQPFAFASRKVRDSITESLKAKVEATIQLPLIEENYAEWKGSCWAMELLLYKPTLLEKRVHGILDSLPLQPASMQQSILEMLLTLYPAQFISTLQSNWPRLGNNKVKAMALEQLALAGHFPDLQADPVFSSSDYAVHYQHRWRNQPPIFPTKNDLLLKDFLPGQNLLVSFQHRNRDKPGFLMIRTADHRWLTDEEGKPLAFAQLARSITNMPWYITNGNTPQGLHKILGTGISNNKWIGPTPNLQLVMPFEESSTPFFADTLNAYAQYRQLLSPLANYEGLYESFYAGKIGRSEIIAHGTTIPTWYYANQPYYPCTPSMGCLCSPEQWSDEGVLQQSVQQEWMEIIGRLSPQPTYLVVVEYSEGD